MRRVNCLSAPRQPQLPGLEDEFEESVSQVSVSPSEEAEESADKNGEAKGHDTKGNSVSKKGRQKKVEE